ncbi:MAG: hypothetical protein PHW75_00625 [Patescibacteria group bacterium]|nr:hypothetical protein [Patescibacteria group bacterium]
MKYLNLKEELSDFIIFSLLDIKKIEPNFDRRRLSEWQDKGYIQKVRRGYYIFSDLEITDEVLFLIANRLYVPSYISLEMALNYYGLIPEGVYSLTSVTTKLPKDFKAPIANFSYRQVKPELFFGYRLEKVGNQNYKIAEIEKVVLDYLYLNPEMDNEANFSEWRFNFDTFREKADMERFATYLSNFNSPSLNTRVRKFIKHMEKHNVNN